jgi:voltage-gated potassium channel
MSVHKHPPPPRSRARLLLHLLGSRLRWIGSIYVAVFFAVAAGMYFAEHGVPDSKFVNMGDSLWYCVVTLSTVGYGDVYPVTALGRVIAGTFILFTLTTIGFLLTAFNEAVLEVKRMEEHGLIPTNMKNHVIVCGFGPLVRVALAELAAADRQVALIVDRIEDIDAARQWTGQAPAFITAGYPTQEILRDRLNAVAAETAVIASNDDTLNMITALNLRAINPNLRIVVALQREELRQTMKASGVTYVASPNELSGRLVASAAFEPEVAHFVEDVTSGVDAGYDLQQYRAAPLAGRTVAEIRSELEAMDGPLLVAVAQKGEGEFEVRAHPEKSLKVGADDYLIVLTNDQQADRFASKYHLKQGR